MVSWVRQGRLECGSPGHPVRYEVSAEGKPPRRILVYPVEKAAARCGVFDEKAEQCIRYGVFPSQFTYTPPGVSPLRKREYVFSGAIRRDFMLKVMERRDSAYGSLVEREKFKARVNEWVFKSAEKAWRQKHIHEAQGGDTSQFLAELKSQLDKDRLTPEQCKRITNRLMLVHTFDWREGDG